MNVLRTFGETASEGHLETELLAQGPHVVAMLQNEGGGGGSLAAAQDANLYGALRRHLNNRKYGAKNWGFHTR